MRQNITTMSKHPSYSKGHSNDRSKVEKHRRQHHLPTKQRHSYEETKGESSDAYYRGSSGVNKKDNSTRDRSSCRKPTSSFVFPTWGYRDPQTSISSAMKRHHSSKERFRPQRRHSLADDGLTAQIYHPNEEYLQPTNTHHIAERFIPKRHQPLAGHMSKRQHHPLVEEGLLPSRHHPIDEGLLPGLEDMGLGTDFNNDRSFGKGLKSSTYKRRRMDGMYNNHTHSHNQNNANASPMPVREPMLNLDEILKNVKSMSILDEEDKDVLYGKTHMTLGYLDNPTTTQRIEAGGFVEQENNLFPTNNLSSNAAFNPSPEAGSPKIDSNHFGRWPSEDQHMNVNPSEAFNSSLNHNGYIKATTGAFNDFDDSMKEFTTNYIPQDTNTPMTGYPFENTQLAMHNDYPSPTDTILMSPQMPQPFTNNF